MTLGGAAKARVRIIVWCKVCQYQVEPDPAATPDQALRAVAIDRRLEATPWMKPKLGPSDKSDAHYFIFSSNA